MGFRRALRAARLASEDETVMECLSDPMKIRKLVADAARYRFLRDTPPWKSPLIVIHSEHTPDDVALLTQDGLDAVIDACLPQRGEEPK